jgi:hypothetical protein
MLSSIKNDSELIRIPYSGEFFRTLLQSLFPLLLREVLWIESGRSVQNGRELFPCKYHYKYF